MRKSLIICLVLVLLPAAAWGRRENVLEGQPAIRHRVELRKGRFEVGPYFDGSLNRMVRHSFVAGLRLGYYLNDWFSLGLNFGYGFAADTGLASELQNSYASSASDPSRSTNAPSWAQMHNRFSDIQLAGDLRAVFTPISGKLALFSKLFVAYDTYFFAGFGFALMKNSGGPYGATCSSSASIGAAESRPYCVGAADNIDAATTGFRPGPAFGVGFHLYFNRFMALGVEIKDIAFSDNETGGDMTRGQSAAEKKAGNAIIIDGDDKKFMNHVYAGLSFTFFLPSSPEISH